MDLQKARTIETGESNEIRQQIQKLNGEITAVEELILDLQDAMEAAQDKKLELEAQRDELQEQIEQKKAMSSSIGELFANAKKAAPSDDDSGNCATDFSQYMFEALAKYNELKNK